MWPAIRARLLVWALLAATSAFAWQSLRAVPSLAAPPQSEATLNTLRHSAPPPRSQAQETRPQTVISSESSLVNLDVLVTDEDGKVLGGLKQENFRVLDNGKPQQITNFEKADDPITVVLVLEYSGAAYNYYAYKGADWSTRFLDQLEPKDWFALVRFDLKPTIAVDFTHSKVELRDALQRLSFPDFNEINLYDAIFETLDRLDPIKGKKAVLLVATGANTFSSHSLDETYRRMKESDAMIFCVGTAEQEFQKYGSSITYLQAKNELSTFAKLTGGHSWFPRFEGELRDIFESVTIFLRNQYRIGFSPGDLPHDGKYHKLKVQIVTADGKPLVVTNPQGKKRKVEVFGREGYVDLKKPRR